jgi:hypothetical protein
MTTIEVKMIMYSTETKVNFSILDWKKSTNSYKYLHLSDIQEYLFLIFYRNTRDRKSFCRFERSVQGRGEPRRSPRRYGRYVTGDTFYSDMSNWHLSDTIESNVEDGSRNTEAATAELRKASKHQRSYRTKLCWCLIVLILIAAGEKFPPFFRSSFEMKLGLGTGIYFIFRDKFTSSTPPAATTFVPPTPTAAPPPAPAPAPQTSSTISPTVTSRLDLSAT